MPADVLQWGGRFLAPPNAHLLTFGSSLGDDLVLAPFDARVSLAHVEALAGGGIVDAERAAALRSALKQVAAEIDDGSFVAFARACGAEDIHGAIDARVRDLAPEDGSFLHSGRSRNDQVATTLALYANARGLELAAMCSGIARHLASVAEEELRAGTILCGTTHWQPAQPILLAFWLQAAAEPFLRDAARLQTVARGAMRRCPLGSAALAGSSLSLDRAAASAYLGFEAPSRNAMDAVGTRDAVLDAADAGAIACIDASRISQELVIWATPAFGYVIIGDASATGSSLMPQKRNPDIFELTRGCAHEVLSLAHGARATTIGMALSYHRDLQQAKRLAIMAIERAKATLKAFRIALEDTSFDRGAMAARAAEGNAVATDVADGLIAAGISARDAHAAVGEALATGNTQSELFAGYNAHASVHGKRTTGSTSPSAVAESLASFMSDINGLDAR